MPDYTAHDPVFRMRHRFWETTDADGGRVLHVESEVDPGGGVTAHVHHGMEERFTVLAGRAEFLSGRRWVAAGPGETVVVPPGTRHAFRNRGDEVTRFVCDARPPSSLQKFLEDTAALSGAGTFTRHGLPRGPRALLRAAVLVDEHRDMVELGFPPLPPRPLQDWVMRPLARLARRRDDARSQRRSSRSRRTAQ